MIYQISARNVNDALQNALSIISTDGWGGSSRNGEAVALVEPVVTEYSHPTERVLFCPERNANPFFHLMESLWMLAGSNELAFVTQFNSGMARYSDDGGVTQPGAYGHRWRNAFQVDQLIEIVGLITEKPDTRRAVLGMWNPATDLNSNSADVPCNTHIYVDTRDSALNLTVLCRSNDALWGAYGANAVHFTVLQEWLAAALKMPVGAFRQYSHNLHVYPAAVAPVHVRDLHKVYTYKNYYEEGGIAPAPLVTFDAMQWLRECNLFVHGLRNHFDEPFFQRIATPMSRAWQAYKEHNKDLCYDYAVQILAQDWNLACIQWLDRAWEKRDANKKA